MKNRVQTGSLLSGDEILRRINSSKPLVTGYINLEKQLQPSGFELTVSTVALFKSPGTFGFWDEERVISRLEEIGLNSDKPTLLAAGSYLVRFNEAVFMPCDLSALAFPRSSLMRCGATLYTAVWDPGYEGRGQGLLCVHNEHGLKLCKNARIAQLVFLKLGHPASRGYSGVYQHEGLAGIEESKP